VSFILLIAVTPVILGSWANLSCRKEAMKRGTRFLGTNEVGNPGKKKSVLKKVIGPLNKTVIRQEDCR
jgi:hypothetical protein